MASARLQDTRNRQKSIVFLYTCNEKSYRELRKQVYNRVKGNKILFKKVQDLYSENYKSLLKEIQDLSEWKDITCSWTIRQC